MVDSVYVGQADGSIMQVDPESRSVLLVPVEVGAWDLTQPQDSITVMPGDTLSLTMHFPYQYRIDSVPFGAIISVPAEENRILGTTPLVHQSEKPLTATLVLYKDGYATAEIAPGEEVINRHSVVLQPLDVGHVDQEAVEWNPRSSRNTWINWAAGGLAVAGGVLAVHFKFTADDYHDQYLETGDEALREEVQRFDTYSYIALGAMQVGIGVLVFRLAF
jgi:hypothetical protein